MPVPARRLKVGVHAVARIGNLRPKLDFVRHRAWSASYWDCRMRDDNDEIEIPEDGEDSACEQRDDGSRY